MKFTTSLKSRSGVVISAVLLAIGAIVGLVTAAGSARATSAGSANTILEGRVSAAMGQTFGPEATVIAAANDSVSASLSTSGTTRCVDVDSASVSCFPADAAGGVSAMLPDGRTVAGGYTPSSAAFVTGTWQGQTVTAPVQNHYYVFVIKTTALRDAAGWAIPVRPTISFSDQ